MAPAIAQIATMSDALKKDANGRAYRCHGTFVLRYVRILGGALSLLGFAFIAHQLATGPAITLPSKSVLPSYVFAALLLVAGNACQGAAWIANLECRSARVGRLFLFRIHGRSVTAKYIPGNVFQFISRQIDLARSPYSQATIAKASVREVAGLAIAAVAFSLMFFSSTRGRQVLENLGAHEASISYILSFVSIAWLIAVAELLRRRLLLWQSLTLYFVFFALFEVAGGILLVAADQDLRTIQPGLLSLSWLVGYVTVGSPGGIGVRESLIVALSSDGQTVIAEFAVLFRLSSVAADILYRAITAGLASRGSEK